MIVRVFHFDSRAPILEVDVKIGSTIRELRATIEARIASEEMCLMRVFTKWYLNVSLGGEGGGGGSGKKYKPMEITEEDEEDTIESIGVMDYSMILLDGPVTYNHEGVGQALAMVNAQFHQKQSEHKRQSDQIALVLDKMISMQQHMAEKQLQIQQLAIEGQTTLLKSVNALVRSQDQMRQLKMAKEERFTFINEEFLAYKTIRDEENSAYETLLNSFHTGQTAARVSVYVRAAKVAFQKHPEDPLLALWEILNDTSVGGPEVAVAIIMDPCCGIEHVSDSDNVYKSKNDYVVSNGATPLLLAAHANRLDVVKAFVELGAKVNVADIKFGVTPLHSAAINQNVEMIQYFVSKGIRVNVSTHKGGTPLHWAAECGDYPIVEALVALGANIKAIDVNGSTPLKRFEVTGKSKCTETTDSVRIRALLTPK